VEVDINFVGPLYISKFNLQIREIVKLFPNQSILWTTGLRLRNKYKRERERERGLRLYLEIRQTL
jgi:hypothetical protein